MAESHDDAMMIIQLARWGTEMGLDEALAEIFSESFDPAVADDANPAILKTVSFFETVGALVKRGHLSGALVNDVWWTSGSWERVKAHALRAREESGEPRLYENFEYLANL